MAKAWKEVAASPQYQGLSPELQERARQQYFQEVVLPRVPAGREEEARQRFAQDTAPAPAATMRPAANITPVPAASPHAPGPRAGAGARFAGGLLEQLAGANQAVQHALPGSGTRESRARADEGAAQALNRAEGMSATLGGDVDWARMGGGAVVPGVVGAMVLPMAPQTLGGATLIGAGQGALAGGLAPVDISRGSYQGQKVGQVASGSLAGAALGPLGLLGLKGGSLLLRKGAERLKTLGAKASPAQMDAELEVLLKPAGINWADLGDAVKQRIREQVTQAKVNPRLLDATQMGRRADAEIVGGIRLTPGDLTRGAGPEGVLRWSQERNLAKLPGGEAAADQISANNQQILRFLDEQRQGVPTPLMTPGEADQAVVGGIRAVGDPVQQLVNDFYQRAFGSQAAALPVNGNRLLQLVEREVAGNGGVINLGRGMTGRLQDVADGRNPNRLLEVTRGQPFTVGDAEALAQYGNAQWPVDPSISRSAMAGAVRGVQRAADEVVPSGQSPFWEGRTMEAARQGFLDETPAYREALNPDILPDGFIKRHVLNQNAKPGNVAALMRALDADDPQAAAAVRAQVLDLLRERAGAGAGGVEGVSQAGLNKTLDAIGIDKLRALFPDEQVQGLLAAGRLSEVINQLPPGHSVNTSNSAIVAAQGLLGLTNSRNPLMQLVMRTATPAINGALTAARTNSALRALPLAETPQPGNRLLDTLMSEQVPMGLQRLIPLLTAPGQAAAVEEASR